MVFVFEFPNQMSGDSFDLLAEAQSLVDAAFQKKDSVLDSDASDEKKLAAMRQFRASVKWTTIWNDVSGVDVPTAVLTINND